MIVDTYGELFDGTRTFNVAEGGMKILEFVFDLLNGLLSLGNLFHMCLATMSISTSCSLLTALASNWLMAFN